MKRRVFLSYGLDRYTAFAEMLKQRLKDSGHEVWFDADRLKAGMDWERYIEDGLAWASEPGGQGCLVLMMTPHSVRRPDGYCLNELASANSKKIPIIPVMLAACEPPLSIARIQRLDMKGCAEELPTKQFESAFERLRDALEHNNLDFQGSESSLLRFLTPPDFSADIRDRLKDFVGREWVFERLRNWLDDPSGSRLFWITGNPGVGKSALAAQIAERFPKVAAFHACVHGNTDKADPRRVVMSVAYQLATQLPEYMERLLLLDLARISAESNAQTMFDSLLVQPLAGLSHPGHSLVVVIDALDEATHEAENRLAQFIAREFERTPKWLRMVVTSRPEKSVTLPLQGLNPCMLETKSEENLDDLRAYLRNELRPFAQREVSPEIIEPVLARSEGVFLYAVYVVRALHVGNLSLQDVDRFPQGVGGIYWDFFQRQFRQRIGERWAQVFEQCYLPVLELLVSSLEGGLPVNYLSAVMNWTLREKTRVLAAIGSLFPVEGDDIRPFHSSVLEWLQDPNQAGDDFVVDVREGHRRHAEWGLEQQERGSLTAHPYAIAHLPLHIAQAKVIKWQARLRNVLLDFDWIHAKLQQKNAHELLEDYSILPSDESCQEIARVIRQAAHIFDSAPTALSQQLFARVGKDKRDCIKSTLTKACVSAGAYELLPMDASLSRLTHTNLVLRGHEFDILQIAISFDGGTIVSASRDQTLRVWDLPTGRLRHVLRGHEGFVNDIAVSVGGHIAVSAGNDKTLRVWDLATGKSKNVLHGHEDRINQVVLTGDGNTAISSSSDNTLRVWDLPTGSLRHVLGNKNDWAIDNFALSSDGCTAASVTSFDVRIWDLSLGILLKVLQGPGRRMNFVAFTPDADAIILACDDCTVRVWELNTGKERYVLRGHEGPVVKVVLTPDKSSVISISDDCTLRIWNLSSGTVRSVLRGHEDSVVDVALDSEGRTAVSVGMDRSLRVWDLEMGKERLKLRMPGESSAHKVRLTPDGRFAIFPFESYTIHVWNLPVGDIRCGRFLARNLPTHGHDAGVTHVVIAADGSYAVSASIDRTLRKWDMSTAAECQVLHGHSDEVTCVTIAADGLTAVSASKDNTLRVWDMTSCQVRHVLRGHEDWVTHVTISADGGTAISSSCDGTLRIWDLDTSNVHHVLRGHTGDVSHVALSPDGLTVVSCSWDFTLRVWDVASGKQRHVLHRHNTFMSHFGSSDGNVAIAPSEYATLLVWEVSSGEQRHLLQGYIESILVAISPDGRIAVAADLDHRLVVWDLATGEKRHVLIGHADVISQIVIALDGHTMVSASHDYTLKVWDIVSGCCTGTFYADAPIVSCDVQRDNAIFIAGDSSGNVHFLRRANDKWFDDYRTT